MRALKRGGEPELKRYLMEVRKLSEAEADAAIKTLKASPYAVPVSPNPWLLKTPEEVAAGVRKLDPPYAQLKTPPGAENARLFSDEMKQLALEANMKRNGGVPKSDLSGVPLLPAQKNMDGITPHPDEWQFDHIIPIEQGGKTTFDNLAIITRGENRRKFTK
jgi:hypothetical protein